MECFLSTQLRNSGVGKEYRAVAELPAGGVALCCLNLLRLYFLICGTSRATALL